MASSTIETTTIHVPATDLSLNIVRRDHQETRETRHDGAETIIQTLGEYAIQQPPGERWQFTTAPQWLASQSKNNIFPIFRQTWATAEELRTRAAENSFLNQHMDMLESSLFKNARITTSDSKLAVTSLAELHTILQDYKISTDAWPRTVNHLFDYVAHNGQTAVENVSLHTIGEELWLATAQTMLNVYYTDEEGAIWKLRETNKAYYDDEGQLSRVAKSTIRSSMGETGHLIDGKVERPYDTARRGLQEELGVEDDDVLQMNSKSSLLRLKRQGHHHFAPIKAEDHTHYFDVWLNPETVKPEGYTNTERHADGRIDTVTHLRWFALAEEN